MGMVKDWFTFQDVLKWFVLRRLEALGSQVEVSRMLGSSSAKTVSAGLHGVNDFGFGHLEAMCELSTDIKHADILGELLEICKEMETGIINREMLDQRLAKASQRGRRRIVAEELDGLEFDTRNGTIRRQSHETSHKRGDR